MYLFYNEIYIRVYMGVAKVNAESEATRLTYLVLRFLLADLPLAPMVMLTFGGTGNP